MEEVLIPIGVNNPMHFDYIAAFLELLGLYLIGRKTWWGFVANIFGGMFWIIAVFANNQMFGLLLVVFPAIVLNIINIRKWMKEEKIKRKENSRNFGDY